MKKENKNFVYNVLYQVFLYVFPLLITPYISRVLGVENIGIHSYTYSIVNCLMLFAMLGISNYGNREISKVRDNKEKLSKTFFSIYYLQIISVAIECIIFILYISFFCDNYKIIFMIQFLNLISVFFDINWFYFGLEKFKLTIKRNFFIKLSSLVLTFIFVKNEGDLWKYTLIMSMSMLLSQVYLMTKLKKYILYTKVNFKDVFKHLKKCLVLFIPVLAYSVYRIMDKTMIGSFSSVTELGFYENAEKLISIPISVISALGTVMLPHMSYLVKEKNDDIIKQKIYSSMKLALIFSVAMAFGLFIISDEAIYILFGSEFAKSAIIVKILCITIIISAWASVIRTQYLIPTNSDKIYVNSTIGGAIVNLFFNILLIRKYGAYGACVGTILAEAFLMLYQTIFTINKLEIKKYYKLLIDTLLKNIVILCVVIVSTIFIKKVYIKFAFELILYIILFGLMYKDFILYEFLNINKGEKYEKK